MRGSGCRGEQLGYADQVVASHGQGELEAKLIHPSQHWPRQPADRLAPTE